MTTTTRITYGEMRSNAERIADEALKARVLAGIEVLNEKYGPDWVDRVDLDDLDLASSYACVLGQVYDGAKVPDDLWADFAEDHSWAYDYHWSQTEGYNRGLAILDGDVSAHPTEYGFEAGNESYATLTDAWLTALGAEGD